jgi:menaquinol-cytochrome c reductase iron-sulfur subunit
METPLKTPCGGDGHQPEVGRAAGPEGRRGFLAKALALALGGVGLLVPAVTGIVAFLNPLRQKSQTGQSLRLTTLDVLPADGTPRRFPVVADRTDAWNRSANEPIGAVFLRRTGDPQEPVLALHVVCPHAGCYIEYRETPEGGKFFCPCHGASFDLNGHCLERPSESPRPMDTLVVDPQALQAGEVRVTFENYQTGTSKKVKRA